MSNSGRPTIRHRSSRVRFQDEIPADAQPPDTNSEIEDYYFGQHARYTSVIQPPQPAALSTNDPFRTPAASVPSLHDSPAHGYPQTLAQSHQPATESATAFYHTPESTVDPVGNRPREGSDSTLLEDNANPFGEEDKYSFGSRQHPFDVSRPPQNAYTAFQPGVPPIRDTQPRGRVQMSSHDPQTYDKHENGYGYEEGDVRDPEVPQHRGVLGNLLDLSSLYRDRQRSDWDAAPSHRPPVNPTWSTDKMSRVSRSSSNASSNSSMRGLDPDDPHITGVKRSVLDDPEDVESQCRKTMDLRPLNYRQRKKEALKIKIQFNVTSMLNRRKFVVKLARALMTFGAPSHRIESQLVAAARILEVDAEFIHLPNIILVCFGDPETKTSETHFIKCGGRLALGALHDVHTIYRQVVHDEISAKRASALLEDVLAAPAIYGTWIRCIIAAFLSALICPLAFGGSTIDMWISGGGAFVLCALQLTVVTKSALYANVFEITVAISISFLARGLSSIRSQIFCYTAISSAAIVGILPGYLILSSSLELASKNILTGSVKMVYALIYTLFLGFGLQIGSDLYLLFDQGARHNLNTLASALTRTVLYTGSFTSDNGTRFTGDAPLSGTFSFMNGTSPTQEHIQDGCYRPPNSAWYLQRFPFWMEFVIVPVFSVLSSLGNLQPWKTFDLVIMVVISCAAYAANKAANHFIFNRSDVVSAIGAFVVGLLGNVYSRRFSGTAFTSMVTGVLFLVPSGLSQAGGITASGNGIDIGAAMIAVTIGITVGLFMSQALVYMFGTRKNAAMFSF